MNTLTYAGTYRGKPLDWGVGLTRNGYPQFTIQLEALEAWDADTQEWKPWGEYEQGITAYLVLAGKTGDATANARQVMKVFGWDGSSLSSLDQGDYSGTILQFRVVDDEFDGKTRKKVVWIDVADSEPGGGLGTVEKLDSGALKALDAKFSSLCKKLSGGRVKVSKPGVQPAPVPKAPPVVVEEPVEEKPTVEPPTRRGRAPKAEAPEYTLATAWQAVVEKTPDVEDEVRSEAWSEILEQIAPGKDESEITQDEWAAIVEYTVASLLDD